jgi:hypothetical protein
MSYQKRYQEVFLENISKKLTSDMYPGQEVCEKYFDEIKNDVLNQRKFYLALNVKTFSLFFQYNLERFLPVKAKVDMNEYMGLIHPEFAQEYIDWAGSVYAYSFLIRDDIQMFNQCYKIMIPMRTIDGYYWVLQESHPLQLDANHSMVTHLNEYTIIAPFDEFPNKTLVGSLWNSHFENKVWTQGLHKLFFTRQPFKLSGKEKEIILLVANNPDTEYKDLLAQLAHKIELHTFRKHAKNITKKAKVAFPNHFAPDDRVTLVEVIQFLSELKISLESLDDKNEILKAL